MIVLLNPNFNCSKKLLSSFVDKVKTGTYNYVSFILNIAFVGEESLRLFVIGLLFMLVITQFADQVKVKDTSQLINDMSKLLQKLLKYFNGTAISTFSFYQICLFHSQDY